MQQTKMKIHQKITLKVFTKKLPTITKSGANIQRNC